MSLIRASLALLAALLGLAALPAVPAGAQSGATQGATQAEAPQILVMVRMSPPHHRPNASYGGSYGDTAARAARQRVAERVAHRNGFTLLDGWPMPLLGVDCFVMRLPAGMAPEEAIARAERDRDVAWSQPLQQFRGMADPQDSRDPLFRTQPAALNWRLMDLHRVATGRGVTVAVVDSKVQTDHPDLAGQFVANLDFIGGPAPQPEVHGTGIAGVIGARSGNGVGIVGVAPDARLMALRACRQKDGEGATSCDSLSVARALDYAIQNRAEVINLSLSGPSDKLLGQLIDIAVSRRIAVVAAFDPKLPGGGFPASQHGVIAASDRSLPSLPPLVYVAPGRDVPTTRPGGKWYLANGSSFAAAHISGLLALMRERREAPRLVTSSGHAVDACASLLQARNGCDCNCALASATAQQHKR